MANPRAIIDAQSACFYVGNCDTEQPQPPIRVSSRQAGYKCLRKASNLQYQLTFVERLNLTGKILLLATLCSSLILLSFCSGFVDAKVHHSKRQTQQQQQQQQLQTPTNQPMSGRASTNWWNVWWQQYINEADQPTVRPIVAVSFNGRSINLSRQEQDQQQLDMTDELSQSSDSDRYDQQSANVLPGRRQWNGKPTQQPSSNQMGWQASRPMERNMISQSGAYDELPLGIQMRGQMSRNRQFRPSMTVVPAEEQQVLAADSGQEEQIQQHYQMLDYSDENDPQLSPQDGKQTNDNDSDQEQSNDSSSQNMMVGENRKPTTLPDAKTSDIPTTTTSRQRTSVILSSSTLSDAASATATTAPSTTTIATKITTTKPLREPTVPSTQATTITETLSPTTPPTTKSSSTKIPPSILETNRIIQTTTKSPIETRNKTQENEESSTAESTNEQTTPRTPVETTIAPLSSTVTERSNQTPNTVASSATSIVNGSNQKLATTTTTEIPSTTTSDRGNVTVMEMHSDANKQGITSSTPSVTVEPGAVESEESSDEDDAGDDVDDEDDSTTTEASVKPSTSRIPTTTQSPESAGPSTQLPVIDLARLPKTTTTTTTTQSTTQQTSTEAPDSPTINSRRPAPEMMNTNDDLELMKTVVEEDSAITLPMETFMRMMNQVAAMNDAAASGSSTPSNLQVMSTTPAITSTTTTKQDRTPDTTTPNSQVIGTTIQMAGVEITTDSKPESSGDTSTSTTPKRKLLPPPTTTEISMTTSEPTTITTQQPISTSTKSNTNEMMNQEDKTTTTGMEGTSSTMGTRRTVMLNIASNDGGSKSTSTDTKIELMDLDLMPIQRMMTQQQTSTSTAPVSLITTTTGNIQPETKQETMVVDVEPGMRLRPPTTLSTMVGAGVSKSSQPIYMVMLNQQMDNEPNNSTTINTKFTTTTGLLTMNPLRSTTLAPQVTSKTTTSSLTTTTIAPEAATTVVPTTKSQAAETKTPGRGEISTVMNETTPVITSTTISPTTRGTTTAESSSGNLTLNATTTSGLGNTSDKPQVVNRGKTINRIFGKQPNGTSSFVSTRLRSNLGTKQLSSSKINQANARLQSNGPSPMVQSMAIRQFGGANRMSVLENQPVAFGRPTMMTSSAQQRFQAPVFEYGASIVVKRPDEPLANGQMPNCTLTGKNFCVLTKDYPMNEVRQAVERSFRSVRIMYEELQTVSDQELHKDDFNATNQAASGKFACQTQVEMMRPGWAKDELTKEWMLVVNTDVFPQRVRTESCAQPNTPCEFIAPFYDSTCQQRYSLHRMIAIDPHDPSRSPQVAIFKFPAGCVCRVHPIRKTPN